MKTIVLTIYLFLIIGIRNESKAQGGVEETKRTLNVVAQKVLASGVFQLKDTISGIYYDSWKQAPLEARLTLASPYND
jgi:hypothetical protein